MPMTMRRSPLANPKHKGRLETDNDRGKKERTQRRGGKDKLEQGKGGLQVGEREEACRKIANDEVGKDRIHRIVFQPTHLVLNFIKSSVTNSELFKDCQSRFCNTITPLLKL